MSLVQALAAQPQIATAIQQASARTGADFNYLLNTAMRESSLDCDAKSKTSSACGLFQFTQQTWFSMMKTEGASHGLGQYADAIRQDSRGRYVVDDPAARQEILALRNDPQVSSLMAGLYANNSREQLESRLGREVSSGELYIAHFLGAGGATKLIRQAEDAPQARADMIFPEAAASNRSIFYDKSGEPRSASELYDLLIAKHGAPSGITPGEIAPRPLPTARLASAEIPSGLIPAVPQNEGEAEAATAILPMMVVGANIGASRSFQSSSTQAGATPTSMASAVTVADAISRSPLQLSPAVLNVLTSLESPATLMAAKSDEQDEKTQSRVEARATARFEPREAFALS